MVFTGHVQKIKCIDWFENDLGFSTCCLGGSIYFYVMYQYEKSSNAQAIGARKTENDYNKKEVKFTCVANVPGKEYEVLAVGSDRMITSNVPLKKGRQGGVDEQDALLS